MSAWDTYGMKTEIVLAKIWIQTPKNDTEIDLMSFCFFLKGGRVYNFVFFWGAVGFLSNILFFCTIFCTRWVAVRPHGHPSVNKNAQTSFLTKNDFFKHHFFDNVSWFL